MACRDELDSACRVGCFSCIILLFVVVFLSEDLDKTEKADKTAAAADKPDNRTAADKPDKTDKTFTMACCLATVLSRTFQLKTPHASNLVEKFPLFLPPASKRSKYLGIAAGPAMNKVLKKHVQIQGHHFDLKHYTQHSYCNQSQQVIWGIGPQGYRCSRK